MKLQLLSWVFVCLLAAVSCKKEAGDGGNSSIRGNVKREFRVVLDNASTAMRTSPAADEDVYILYGDHISPDDRVQTNYNGEYEFLYLRPGKYKVYTFSKDTNAVAVPWDEDHMTVIREVEITDGKQQVSAADMTIYDTN